jgi:hypothetical protein
MRSGASFFYLPDQDHGREASIFVPFFGHPKATLPALPKLVKLTGARAVPILACYDEEEGCYRLEIEPPFDPYPGADLVADVNQMNGMVEQQLRLPRAVHVVSQDLRNHGAPSGRGRSLRGGDPASARAAGTLIDTAPLRAVSDRVAGHQQTGANKVRK